ncbi:DUF4865 family protein [Rhizobium jaguaris]|uniref:DUF4865 family protein n=1 Tax=Rhizobium jaguaris TaxID=1312183 RepID=A0A387FPB8_9HYPH|nr:DUF4865 family protein [Rhizobium jaguaris]AYG60379.1 DUF4865 family protein [Rhizobium jaguaris]
MIAMQYSFTLPAGYDMAIIDHRVRDKGPMLDNFPGLKFKAYLTARKGDGATESRENLYAPFYIWEKDEGLSNFICGPGFVGLTDSFGWPQVRTWIVWAADVSPDIRNARFATREIVQIEPYAPLAEIRRRESDAAPVEIARGEALASVAAFEPTSWTRVRFRLLADLPKSILRPAVQAYAVGHLSLPDVS